MNVRLLAAGTRMPAWVTQGYETFVQRLNQEVRLSLVEIPLFKRGRGTDAATGRERDGERMLAKIDDDDWVIALDVKGKRWSTKDLSGELDHWLTNARPVTLLIGGPDGLSADCMARASQRWSLSDLTLPHGLVRVVVAEALYRAWSLRHRHPYHRA